MPHIPRLPIFVYKLLAFIGFLSLFILVIFFIEPPASWQEASVFQMLAFFVPILLALTAVIDILMHYFPHSFIISLGVIMFLAFYAVNQLNILTGVLVFLITAFFVRVFPRMRLPRFRLTGRTKIPKLHMSSEPKVEEPKIRRLRRLGRG